MVPPNAITPDETSLKPFVAPTALINESTYCLSTNECVTKVAL